MELFLFFLIVAVGGFWYYNHLLNKRAREQAESQSSKEAPYKVEEPKLQPKMEIVHEPVMEVKEPVAETVAAVTEPSATVKKPRKPAIKKPSASKAVGKKTKTKSAKIKK